VTFGEGETNVAATLANFGIPVDFVTRLPQNDLGDACLNYRARHPAGGTQNQEGVKAVFLKEADKAGNRVHLFYTS